ncbi:NEAT domain-containing protein [Clostridium botulinum]|uniref:NEAT domain-containing protein n=1 Tax=Clostridium botulinum TaxID=1491 RepID=UPI000699F603|nr:NEAT domain-containing protein [Clostridium botulinum]KOA75063.1 hypothetical protein ADU78_09210 [Clostridium botulinum]KOC34028.1 hypothetical protein ADU81_07570 [Clostridium botulinum]NFF60112.1 LPXTG cell wall anchor domain-containing protein [Clostridium botulinum]NFL03240.1 LPXTG cell wall anchor domain-containing protein [Clostridium botulinum]
MDMLKRINKGVGVAATAIVLVGGMPVVVQAMPNSTDIPKIEAKAICKDIEKSIKNGKYEVNGLNEKLYSNMNISSQKQEEANKKEEIKVKVLKDTSENPSMAGEYIEKVQHEIVNGKHYLILSVDSIDWMSNITASIDDEVEVKTQELERSAKITADGKGKEKGKIKFQIKDLNSKILMHMNVQPMGNNRVAFRVIPVNVNTGEHNKNKTNNKEIKKDENNKVKDNKKETGKKKNLQKRDTKDKQDLNKKSIEDGVYTIGFEAYHLENPQASSMLGNFFDKNVKLEVKNGKKKITMLNTCFADGVLDFRIGSDNIFKESIGKWYGKANDDGKYPYKTYEIEISELQDDYMACVLAGPMGGVKKDIGDFSKYKKAKIVFNNEYKKGWNGFERDKKVVDYNKNLTTALIEAGVDKDGNGIITEDEIASIKEELNISVKSIKDISFLKNLGSDIKRLYLIGNYIDKLPEGIFDKLTNLEVLYLNGNNIKELPIGVFDKLTNLKELQLNQNNIEEIPNGIFDKLVNLKSLVISDNPLKKADFSTLNKLNKLEYLSIENCNLKEIPKEIFNLGKLTTFNASRNNISIVPKEIIKLKDLKELNLSSNYIEEIPQELYTNLPNLQVLQMNDNLLKSIPLDVFYKSPKLRSLDFIMNKLDKIPEVPNEFKKKKSTWAYPQKTYMDIKLSAKDGKITWTQNLSGMDMIVWKMIHPSGKTATTLEEYKKEFEKKEILELMHDNSCDPTVKTIIQKKNSNGDYTTLKQIISEDKIDVPEIVEDKNMQNGDEYRIVKLVSARSYSMDVYVLRDVAYAKAVVGADTNNEQDNNIADGIYTVGFTAYKVEDRNETSMLNNFFDKKAKLEVKDGKMKITLLNICFADGLYDFRIKSNGKFPESVAKGYGKLDHKDKYPFKTFEVNISDINSEHEGCVLVGPMGGLVSDIGNFDKYRKVMFVFDKNNLKEWNGFDEDHKKIDDDKQFNKVLVAAKLDKDGDGIVTNEELALAEGEISLPRKEIKNISRLQFLGKNVTALDLTGNEITELPDGVFDNLTKLKKLDIHGNYIKKLPKGIFDKLTELTELHIGMNQFKELPQGIFDRLTKLKQLSIYNMHTPLSKIDDNAFANLKNLEYLSLEETGISKIPESVFALTNLQHLILSKNQLKTIPKQLSNLKKLTWLDLGTNYIEKIPDEVYKNLNKLTMFQIKDNQLTKIPLNIWELIPENKRLDCSLNKLAVVPKLPDSLKGKRWITAYPQKQALKLQLSANDGQVKWDQELSALDIICWFKIASSFDTKKIPENINEYKEQLGKKTPLEFLKEKDSEPRIVTEIQKKDKDGTYKTIKEIVKFNEEDSGSSYIDSDMKNGDEYRILKKVYVISYSYEYYIFTDVAYVKATVNGNSNEKPEKPRNEEKQVINIEKPAVYEGKVGFDNKENKENEKIAAKYVDMEQKINVEVKDKQAYMTIKLKGQQKDIKAIKVDGDKVKEFEVIGEEVVKINRLAALNEVSKPKVKENKDSTTIRFKIPNEKSKVEITMHNEVEDKDETFAIKLKEDTIKKVKDNSNYIEKPSNTSTSTSHKHKKHKKNTKENKKENEVKPSEEVKNDKENKKDDNTSSNDTSTKEEKDSNKKDQNIKDNKDTKKDKKEQKKDNISEKQGSEDPKQKEIEKKQENSKEVNTEDKKQQNKDNQKQNKVTSKAKSSSTKSTESKSNKKATEIKEKKLPQTGMPFGSGLFASIGSALSGLGVVLMRKNRKNKK